MVVTVSLHIGTLLFQSWTASISSRRYLALFPELISEIQDWVVIGYFLTPLSHVFCLLLGFFAPLTVPSHHRAIQCTIRAMMRGMLTISRLETGHKADQGWGDTRAMRPVGDQITSESYNASI